MKEQHSEPLYCDNRGPVWNALSCVFVLVGFAAILAWIVVLFDPSIQLICK